MPKRFLIVSLLPLLDAVLTQAKNPLVPAAPSGGAVFRDVQSFNAAAGQPPISMDFENTCSGDDLSGKTACGITLLNHESPLIVVDEAETFTPIGFEGLEQPEEHALRASSGHNLLSPGGPALGPGPNPAIEDDDMTLRFDPPVAAVGFDHISQLADGMSYTHVQVIATDGSVRYEGTIDIGEVIEQRWRIEAAQPESTIDFWGYVSQQRDIAEIRIDERDDNNICPDSNIGIDTIRTAPSACITATDLTGDGRIDTADIAVIMALWGSYEVRSGDSIRWLSADLNRDRNVDSEDLMLLMAGM